MASAELLDKLSCRLFGFNSLGHRIDVYEIDQDTRLLKCHKCHRKWVMQDRVQALVRYDNDPEFKKDLMLIYPKLEEKFKTAPEWDSTSQDIVLDA